MHQPHGHALRAATDVGARGTDVALTQLDVPDLGRRDGLGVQPALDQDQARRAARHQPVGDTERAQRQQLAVHDSRHDDRRGPRGEQHPGESFEPSGHLQGVGRGPEAERVGRLDACRPGAPQQVRVVDQTGSGDHVQPGERLGRRSAPRVQDLPELGMQAYRCLHDGAGVGIAVVRLDGAAGQQLTA